MENFEEMLEKYLDDEEMKSKYIEDEKENVVEIKNIVKKIGNNFESTISISEFVSCYLGTEHKCKNLKHKGLKSFNNPYVIGISNEFAIKNPDCIIRNEIVVVIDDYGNPGTYINPNILKQIKNMEEYKNTRNLLEKIKLHNLDNIDILYNEYNNIIKKIDELEKTYIDSCDLLKCLEKKYILREIRKYVKKASKINIECLTQQKEVQENVELQYNLLNNTERNIEESLFIDFGDNYEYVNCKVNRQKNLIKRNKKGIIRKGF